MKIRYITLGLLLIALLFIAAPAHMQGPEDNCGITPSGVGNPHTWDRSSLTFTNGCSNDGEHLYATICNGEDSGMKRCSTAWALYYHPTQNPKRGTTVDILASDTSVPPLAPGECFTITVPISSTFGKFMFWATQAEDHPGNGELWSEACTLTPPRAVSYSNMR